MPAKRRRPDQRRAAEATEQVRLARQVQQGLLPPAELTLPEVEVAGRYLPSWSLGGDFYDYFRLDDGALALYLGDVQGKGLAGALDALLVSGLLRGVHKAGARPAELLALLNQRLCLRRGPGRFSCLGYALLERSTRRLTFANAGLPFPLLARGGDVRRLELTGSPVGLFEDAAFDETRVELAPGDRVLFYSDGVTDALRARDPGGRDRDEQLRELVRSAGDVPAAQGADALLRRLRRRGRAPRDDISFVLLRIR